MSDLYEDYGLEIEPDNFGADPQLTPQKTTVIKKGGILGKVVALALGFTIGAGGVIGGVAGGVLAYLYFVVQMLMQEGEKAEEKKTKKNAAAKDVTESSSK